MALAARIALATAILLVDFVTFFVPLCALVVAWVVIARPRWALELIVKLYEGIDFNGPPGRVGGEAASGRSPD